MYNILYIINIQKIVSFQCFVGRFRVHFSTTYRCARFIYRTNNIILYSCYNNGHGLYTLHYIYNMLEKTHCIRFYNDINNKITNFAMTSNVRVWAVACIIRTYDFTHTREAVNHGSHRSGSFMYATYYYTAHYTLYARARAHTNT